MGDFRKETIVEFADTSDMKAEAIKEVSRPVDSGEVRGGEHQNRE
jgi:hypothetical protein